MSKANKLKNLDLNSVDFVKRGANPDADISLFKSMDGMPGYEEEPVKKSFWSRLGDSIAKALSVEMDDIDPYEEDIFKSESVMKAERIEKAEDTMYRYTGALEESFSSIFKDDSLHEEERQALLLKSLGEFADTVEEDIIKSFTGKAPKAKKETTKTNNEEMEEIDDMRIDKSLLTTEEAAAFDALVAKATPADGKKKVPAFMIDDDDDDDDEMEAAKKACGQKKTKKSTAKDEEEMMKSLEGMPPAIQKAYRDMVSLTKSMEMKEFEDIAKTYAPLGYDTAELSNTLYDLKKSNEKHYDAYIDILNKSMTAIQSSGMFGEIGKSYTGSGVVAKSGAVGKIENIAKGYMEKDPTMDRNTALAKAWEDNPDIAYEYEKEAGGAR